MFPSPKIVDQYRAIVHQRHPTRVGIWPIVSGHDALVGGFRGWQVLCLRHTGEMSLLSDSLGELGPDIMQVDDLNGANLNEARRALEKHFNVKPKDAVVFVQPDGTIPPNEYELMLRRHEDAMGISPKMIFLSRKGADKALVGSFKDTLEILGFEPWLDEEAMVAGTGLEREISARFDRSCAAVFFVTSNLLDEAYLATEVGYAIREKRVKGDNFAIIAIVFTASGEKGIVPKLLQGYVWKEPASQLEALREIIRALPVVVGEVHWR